MTRLSICLFENTNFTGWARCFTYHNWSTWWGYGNDAGLVRARRDDEIVIALRDVIDTPSNREVIDDELPDNMNRTSGLRAGMVNYGVVEYAGPDRHPSGQTLVDVSFTFEVDLPWTCLGRDAIGNIHYYVLVTLDSSGTIQADVDGWTWHRERGGLCRERVDDALDDNVPDGMSALQSEIDSVLGPVSALTFDDLYFLPGDGEYSGMEHVSNVRHNAALVLVR